MNMNANEEAEAVLMQAKQEATLIDNTLVRRRISWAYPYLWAIIRNQGPYWISTDFPIGGITDGYRIYINRKGFDMIREANDVSINDEDLLTYLLIHESLHLSYKHFKRAGDRHKTIWNVACDIAIDYDISHYFKDLEYTKPLYQKLLEKLELSDDFIKDIPNMSAEQIYDRLIRERPNVNEEKVNKVIGVQRAKHQQKNPEIGEHAACRRAVEDHERKSVKNKAADTGDSEMDFARIPGEVIRKIYKNQFGKSPPWQRILAEVAQDRMLDNGYVKPDRRFDDVYIPDVYLEECPVNIAIAVDTSSSIDENKLAEFMRYLNEINKISRNSNIKIIICDMVVYGVHKITDFDQALHLQGGGATEFGPVFEVLKGTQTDVLIYFTDTECQDEDWWWNVRQKYEIIWAIPVDDWKRRRANLYGRHIMVA